MKPLALADDRLCEAAQQKVAAGDADLNRADDAGNLRFQRGKDVREALPAGGAELLDVDAAGRDHRELSSNEKGVAQQEDDNQEGVSHESAIQCGSAGVSPSTNDVVTRR
jgi:hypothetical protein